MRLKLTALAFGVFGMADFPSESDQGMMEEPPVFLVEALLEFSFSEIRAVFLF
jgi:hypothetical protein